MRHKWQENPNDKRSRYNKICSKCGLEKIVSPWNVRNVEYKLNGKFYYSLPKCTK